MKAVSCSVWKLPLVLSLAVIERLLNPIALRDIGISVFMAQIFKKDFPQLDCPGDVYFGYAKSVLLNGARD